MKKLIRGIVEFRKKLHPEYRDTFRKLALEQKPDALFIACSDSRVAANVFASTDPGDLFVIRNVGNMIPKCGYEGISMSDLSEIAAIEFAIQNLQVKNIIVCGHSECGAINSLHSGREQVQAPHLREWLGHADGTKLMTEQDLARDETLAPHNRLSQLNVLLQMKHLMSYSLITNAVRDGKLQIHGWWFDIAKANVYAFEEADKKFILIDEEEAKRLEARVSSPQSI